MKSVMKCDHSKITGPFQSWGYKEALEKQIPKKPNIHGYREGREVNTISYTCPICNKHIGRENFCNHCGQALDWSDTERPITRL